MDLITPKITALLLDVPLFQGMQPADLEPVLRSAQTVKVDGDGFFFQQGDPAEKVFVLLSGKVKLAQLSPDGQQVLVRVLPAGGLFGAVAMTGQGEYPVSAQAVEASQALTWSREEIMALMQRYPQMALNAMRLMADQVQELQARFRQLATERVERRLARTLIRLAAQSGRKTDKGVLIDLPLTRQDLAEMIGATLFTVSRTLSQWEGAGLVRCGRERVVICYPHGLVSIAEDIPLEK